LLKKNKVKPRPPTVEEFLQFIPVKREFEWHTNEEDLVRITVPKFKGQLGGSFCKIIRKENTFTANLDKIGSLVWTHCDGKNNVKEILKMLKKKFPKEEDIDQRLFLFLQQMKSLNYIDFR
jgi:hypothetical protein